jgi:hypothetical protein
VTARPGDGVGLAPFQPVASAMLTVGSSAWAGFGKVGAGPIPAPTGRVARSQLATTKISPRMTKAATTSAIFRIVIASSFPAPG